MKDNKQVCCRQIQEYDCLRVILTLLVVVGHCTYYKIVTPYGGCDYSFLVEAKSGMFRLFESLTGIIYHFHMALFMCLSGALFYIAMKKGKYNSILFITKDKACKLLIPFLIASLFYSFPIKYLSGYYCDSNNVIKDFIIGQILLQGNSHLWYCLTLFLIYLIAYIIETGINTKPVIKIIILLFLCMVSSKIEINIVSYLFEFLFWFYVGYYFEQVRLYINNIIEEHKSSFVIYGIIFAVELLIYQFLKKNDDLIFQILTRFIEIILTASLSLGVYIIAYITSKTRIINTKTFKLIKKDSYGIYLYSDSWNYVVLSVSTSFFGSMLYSTNVGAIALYVIRFVLPLGISIFAVWAIRKLNLKYLC